MFGKSMQQKGSHMRT